MLNIGHVILHYRITELLDRGETGVVYRAEDLTDGRSVAFKTYDWNPADDPGITARLRKEAAAVQALQHPNICRVEHIDVCDSLLCVVMELVDGSSLDELICGRPLKIPALIQYAVAIASALDAAHRRAILHNDLKPSKVIVSTAGVKVVDFGVGAILKMARLVGLTSVGQLLGVLSYASPERMTSKPLDSRSDLFSFGSIIYEMATGQPPFRGNTVADVVGHIMRDAPASPCALNAAVPSALQDIILKALEKDRDARYQSAGDVLADLRRLGETLQDRTPVPAATAAAPSAAPSAAPPSPPAPAPAAPPTALGRYQIIREVAQGGMGAVYLARDAAMDRLVAIKWLLEREDRPEAHKFFISEARAVGRLHHPNIVTIFDFGDHDGRPFIVMEYIEGETFAELIRREAPLPLARKLEIMDEVCTALGYAHRAGVIHRDIKPSNIKVGDDGKVKVLDFGIAQGNAASPSIGVLAGTIGYVAPELLLGKTIDIRVDIFAAGAVFYELLSYRRAFAPDAGGINATLNGTPEPLERIVPSLDPQLIALVNRCLEKDPDRRYPDMAAVRADLSLVRSKLAMQQGALESAGAAMSVRPRPAATPPSPVLVPNTDIFAPPPAVAAAPASRLDDTGVSAPPPVAAAPPVVDAPGSRPADTVVMARPPASPVGRAARSTAAEPAVLQRTLDLAAPKSVPVLTAMELVALLRLPESPALDTLLRLEGEGALSRGVRTRDFNMEFLRDADGALKPTIVTMRVTAPDFDPPLIEKRVRVRPESDSERQTFLLTPQKRGHLRLQFDVLLDDVAFASRSLETEALASDATVVDAAPAVVTIPLKVEARRQNPIVAGARDWRRWILYAVYAATVAIVLAIPAMRLISVRNQRDSEARTHAQALANIISSTDRLVSSTRTLKPVPTPAANPLAQQHGPSYALVVGVDEYANLPKLTTAVNDATAMEEVLRTRFGFQTEILKNATRYEILTALSRYRSSLPNDANLIVYYAGHGYFDKEADKAYWLPADAQAESSANWIIADDITSAIRAIPAKHVLVIADSCYSGALTRDPGPVFTPQERDRYLSKMEAGKSRTLLSSGGNEPVSDAGGAGNHSIFAATLLNGLDAIAPEEFTAQELFANYIGISVAGRSQQTPQYAPIRNSGHDSGDFVFVRKGGR